MVVIVGMVSVDEYLLCSYILYNLLWLTFHKLWVAEALM